MYTVFSKANPFTVALLLTTGKVLASLIISQSLWQKH
jgi:hypothetical protein